MSAMQQAAAELAQTMNAFLAMIHDLASKPPSPPAPRPAPVSWRERLWSCPDSTRLGVREAAEALGRPRSFIYRRTRARSIPFRRLDGELVFVASELREWVRRTESVVVTPGGRHVGED